jgi:hypothetical protein
MSSLTTQLATPSMLTSLLTIHLALLDTIKTITALTLTIQTQGSNTSGTKETNCHLQSQTTTVFPSTETSIS